MIEIAYAHMEKHFIKISENIALAWKQTCRSMKQNSKIESPEIKPCIQDQLICDKEGKDIQ